MAHYSDCTCTEEFLELDPTGHEEGCPCLSEDDVVAFAVDDEFSNQITCGLESYDAAVQVARRYLSAHRDAPCVRIYEDTTDGEGWDLTRDEVLS